MSSRPDSFMPFYVGDYLKDTLRLTTLQHGAYVLLLCAYWTGGPLPDDDDALAAIAKLGMPDWKRVRTTLGKLPFFDIRDGLWHQKRADEELSKAQTRYERAIAGAHAMHKQRRSKKQAGDKQVLSTSDAHANHNHTATQEGSPSELPSCDSSARQASRRVKAAPPVALEVPPGWEQKSEKWAEFRSKLSDGEWRAWFAKARLNGSELSLLLDSEFAKDQVLYRYGKTLEEHFGRRVSLTFDQAAYQAALEKNP